MPLPPVPEAKRAETEVPVHELVTARWSPCAFSEEPVPEADLRALFEAARWAPSSYNEQPWRYIVARRDAGADAWRRLLSCLVEPNQRWARTAPVLALGVVQRRFERNDRPNAAAEHDLGLAAGSLLVEATSRGLLVHQMIGILPDRARELYAIPEDFDPLTGLAIGYAGDPDALPESLAARDRSPRARRPLEDFVFGERFGTAARLPGGGAGR